MKLPIDNCYWVVPGKLLAGEYPRDRDLESSIEKLNSLLEAGVKAFIDLTEENEGLDPYSDLIGTVTHQRFPIRDLSVPDSHDTTVKILDAIDNHIECNCMVYVHCWGGVGRTGTIVGCWLARHNDGVRSPMDRLNELWKQCAKSIDRQSPETKNQSRYILNWKPGR